LAPDLCWLPTRIAADSHLSKRLITLLDREKGIIPSPFAEIALEAKTGGTKAVEGGEKEVAVEEAEKEDGMGVEVDAGKVEEKEEGKEEGIDGEGKEEEEKAVEKVNGDAMETEAPTKEEKAAGERISHDPVPASLGTSPGKP